MPFLSANVCVCLFKKIGCKLEGEKSVAGNNEELEQYKMMIASLESKVDLLEAELTYLNQLLLRFGFPEGIDSLKLAIEELLDDDTPPPPRPHSP